jgi:putative ABC transport system ATP-binding protein
MLKCIDTTKKFVAGRVLTTALNGISLEIEAGEYVAITGPSGCGKSTLLSILGMLDTCDSGEYWFNGENVAGWSEARLSEHRRGRVGFIFQSFNLIEELSVAENVALALEYSAVPARERREQVAQLLGKLGIGHRAGHRPSQLSGGQQQRAAIARALITKPSVLLADEPTGNLDTEHGEEVMRILEQIHDEGTTIVMVTHSLAHAARASRMICVLDCALASPAANVTC